MNAVLSEKGQVTIPKNIRDGMGLAPGTVLDFEEENGRIIVRKVVAENPIAAWRGRGRLPSGKSVEEYISTIRDGE
jgi:AbrB family looped-hinge helix DNA binding protein